MQNLRESEMCALRLLFVQIPFFGKVATAHFVVQVNVNM
jgi:hypothetical protein